MTADTTEAADDARDAKRWREFISRASFEPRYDDSWTVRVSLRTDGRSFAAEIDDAIRVAHGGSVRPRDE